MDWPCHQPRNLHYQDRSILNPRGKAKEGTSEDHLAADGSERTVADGKVMPKDRQKWRYHVASLHASTT